MQKMDLKSALIQLQKLEDDGKEINPAMGIFAECHGTYLVTGDFDGFYWSLQLLQGIIRRAKFKTETSSELFTSLIECFSGIEVESTTALAAFHVAKMRSGNSDGNGIEETENWYRECFVNAKEGYLKYLAALGLGELLLKYGKYEKALEWFEVAMENARNKWEDSFAIASYFAAKTLAMLKHFEQAISILIQGSGTGYFASVLASMLYADYQSSAENALKAHAVARKKLANLMPNLHKSMAEYCSIELLLKYLNLGNFSRYFILEASSYDHQVVEAAKHIERSFFVYEMYTSMRNSMLRIHQEVPNIPEFMDPRPDLEQGFEFLISKNNSAALEHIVISQQAAVKSTHTSCLILLRSAFKSYVRRVEDHSELKSNLVASFKQHAVDGEDPEAWANFYIGLGGMDANAKMSNVHYERTKEALARSRTPLLRFYVTNILGAFGMEAPGNTMENIELKLKYLGLSKVYAQEIGRSDLIILALHDLFELVMLGSWMFDRASSIQQEMKEMSSTFQEPDRTLGLAVSQYMMGLLMQHYSRFVLGLEYLKSALELLDTLPRFSSLGCLHFYLTTDGEESWSFERNQIAIVTSGNITRLLGAARPDLIRLVEEDEETLRHHNLKNSMDRLEALILEERVTEAEEQAAELLGMLERSQERSFQTYKSLVRLSLARLTSAKHRQAGKTSDLRNTLDTIDKYMEDAGVLAKNAAKLAPVMSLGIWLHACYSKILLDLGEKSAALAKLQEFLALACFQLEDNFGLLSIGRITNLEILRPYFRDLEGLLWEFKQLPQALVWGERQRARDLLYTIKLEADREMHLKQLADFDKDFDRAWAFVQGVCDMMGKDTVLLVISHDRFEGVVYTYFLHPDIELVGHKHEHVTPVSELLRFNGSSREILAEYYDILVRPFAKQLEQVQPKTIIFVPSEEMCMVPFAALVDESSPEKPYLIQRYATSTVSSLRLLKQCELRAQELRNQKQVIKEALVIGNPTMDLEFADAEADSVEDILKQADFDVHKPGTVDVTKQMVLSLIPECSWIHIASHGIVSPEFPDGALLLSSSLETQGSLVRDCLETSLTDGDLLTGKDIQELKVSLNASGVVLSACSSGLGRIFSEGILALPRSFHLMGVPAAVVSLWKVDDQATRFLMERMYGNLVRGMQLGESIQRAMQEMLEEKDELEYPNFEVAEWASFIVSGSPFIRLDINKRKMK